MRKSLKQTSEIGSKDSVNLRLDKKEKRLDVCKTIRREADIQETFSLQNIPLEDLLVPKKHNFNCCVYVTNIPSYKWLNNNILGCYLNLKKKHMLVLYIDKNKLEFTCNKLNVYGKENCLDVLKKFQGFCHQDFDITVAMTRKKIKRNKFVTVLHLSRLNVIKIEEFFDYVRYLRNDFLNPNFIDINGDTPWTKSTKFPKSDPQDPQDVVLQININILNITGVKNNKDTRDKIEKVCRLINSKVTKKMQYDKFIKITHIVYQFKIPKFFTCNLLDMYKKTVNFKYAYFDRIESSYTIDNFPAFIIKIFGLPFDKKKLTLQIYESGFISILGLKKEQTLCKIYPYVMDFLSQILTEKKKFVDMFVKLETYPEDIGINKQVLFEWKESKKTLKAITNSFMDIKLIKEFDFKNSDIKPPKRQLVKNMRRESVIDPYRKRDFEGGADELNKILYTGETYYLS